MDILKFLNSISLSINITLDNLIICFILMVNVIAFVRFVYKIIIRYIRFDMVDLDINIANIGAIHIKNDKEIKNIAHKAWIEIMTRKVGLLFEEDKDVIVEVYNSWYMLFGIIRELLKEIKPNKKNEDMKKLEDILIKTLNNGLRPHLTNWQAEFRRWYNNAIENEENKGLSPQMIQKKYDRYDELMAELKATNQQMVQFANELKKLI